MSTVVTVPYKTLINQIYGDVLPSGRRKGELMNKLNNFEQAANEVIRQMRFSHNYPYNMREQFIEMDHMSPIQAKLRIYDIDRIRHADFLRAFKKLRDAWEPFYEDLQTECISYRESWEDFYESLVQNCIDKIMYYQELLEREV